MPGVPCRPEWLVGEAEPEPQSVCLGARTCLAHRGLCQWLWRACGLGRHLSTLILRPSLRLLLLVERCCLCPHSAPSLGSPTLPTSSTPLSFSSTTRSSSLPLPPSSPPSLLSTGLSPSPCSSQKAAHRHHHSPPCQSCQPVTPPLITIFILMSILANTTTSWSVVTPSPHHNVHLDSGERSGDTCVCVNIVRPLCEPPYPLLYF